MKKEKTYGKILVPPTRENVKKWIVEKFGDDFEPKYLESIIDEYLKSVNTHSEYAKKLMIKYISKNIFILDRIYRKQELLYWIKRGWDQKTAENKRVVRDKNWYIKTYGDELGVKKFNDKNTNIANNCGHTLDKYIDRYGSVIGPIKYDDYKKGCARNLEFFIKKYGEKEGKIKFKEFKKHIGKASKESMLVFKPIINWLSNLVDVKEIYYGDDNSREFFIVKNSKVYLYDFTIKSLNLIIEFNGFKFHANELATIEEQKIWKHPFNKITFQESIEYDKFKNNLAIENGFKVLTIWSNIPVEENIKICKQFIENEIK